MWLRPWLALLVACAAATGAVAAGKRGSPERAAECLIAQAHCKAACPPWPGDAGCATRCDIAYVQCQAAPDAQGSRVFGRQGTQGAAPAPVPVPYPNVSPPK